MASQCILGSTVEGVGIKGVPGLPTIKGLIVSHEGPYKIPPAGITIVDNTLNRPGEMVVLASDVLNLIKVVPPRGNVTVPEIEPSSLQTALTREEEALRTAAITHLSVGVSPVGQYMFDRFFRQLPKYTRWFTEGNSQDIVVLGIRVRQPYKDADCCELLDPTASKSLKRIKDMVIHFIKEMPKDIRASVK